MFLPPLVDTLDLFDLSFGVLYLSILGGRNLILRSLTTSSNSLISVSNSGNDVCGLPSRMLHNYFDCRPTHNIFLVSEGVNPSPLQSFTIS